MSSEGPVLLAFSGGLDTSWCVLHLVETKGLDVVTVTVDTGGFSADELERIAHRAGELGAGLHYTVDARQVVAKRFGRYFIAANALRGGAYPLCVAAERVVQAEEVARKAKGIGASAVAHGSTGAGNDQIRFDVAMRVLLPGVPVLAPVREHHLTREAQTKFLKAHGIDVPPKTTTYSVNRGLWGTTIGGGLLHDPSQPIPADCWQDTIDPDTAPAEGVTVSIGFEEGFPIALDGAALEAVDLIGLLNLTAAEQGVGRGIHTGDTILGIKGRLAFEAPAPMVLINAHRELEKLVLTKEQQAWKDRLGVFYGELVHEGRSFDPVVHDVEAFLRSSQRHVTGTVTLRLVRGRIELVRIDTQASLMGRLGAVYGEGSAAWTGEEARGFGSIYGLPSVLAAQRDRDLGADGAGGAHS
jgi:argininosuccinate synthase